MTQDGLIQKLVDEVVTQRVVILSLIGVLAVKLGPDNPDKEYEDLKDLVERGCEAIRSQEVAALSEKWGVPLAPEALADMGLGGAFEAWFRRETGEGPVQE